MLLLAGFRFFRKRVRRVPAGNVQISERIGGVFSVSAWICATRFWRHQLYTLSPWIGTTRSSGDQLPALWRWDGSAAGATNGVCQLRGQLPPAKYRTTLMCTLSSRKL